MGITAVMVPSLLNMAFQYSQTTINAISIKDVGVIRLCFRENRIHEIKMKKCR